MPQYRDTIIAFQDYFDEPRIARDFRKIGVSTYHDYMNALHLDRHDEELPAIEAGIKPIAKAFINMGRWVWGCTKCESCYILERGSINAICTECYEPEWVTVEWPEPVALGYIERRLLEISGPRLHAPLRNWEADWPLEDLAAMVDEVHLRVLEGRHNFRSLSIGQTRNWTAGERLTATNMNLFITQILRDTAGRNGTTQFENAIQLKNMSTPSSPGNGTLFLSSSSGYVRARMSGRWYNWLKPSDVDARVNRQSMRNDLIYSQSISDNGDRVNANTLSSTSSWRNYDLILFNGKYLFTRYQLLALTPVTGNNINGRELRINPYDNSGYVDIGIAASTFNIIYASNGTRNFEIRGHRWRV